MNAKWETTEIRQPIVRHEIRHNNIWVTLDEPNSEGKSWNYFSMSFGVHSLEAPGARKAVWPREAIAQARQALDDFEESLDE